MARKRKTFDPVSVVKSVARERIGQPHPVRVEQPVDKDRIRGAKHKQNLEQLRREADEASKADQAREAE